MARRGCIAFLRITAPPIIDKLTAFRIEGEKDIRGHSRDDSRKYCVGVEPSARLKAAMKALGVL